MTIGQRIAQKRRDLGLSQEALGERMGVSRQAIYKWEADAALPEIEKLVMLSRLFEVSVGWLLGVEEPAEPTQSTQPTAEELTPAQLKMAEEIAQRYIDAMPQPKPRRKWPWVLATCLTGLVLFNLFAEMEQLNNRYNNLQNSVGNITSSVNMQINGIAGRVEEILKAQNNLTAEYDTEILSVDYRNSKLTIRMTAVPKTFTEGMRAVFVVDEGNGPMEFEGNLTDGRTFSVDALVPLSDRITVSVVFVGTDGIRHTQLLETYANLLSESYASFSIGDHRLWNMKVEDEKLPVGGMTFDVRQIDMGKGKIGIAECKLGLFCNQELIAWAEPCQRPSGYQGFDEEYLFYRLPNISAENIQTGDKIAAALLVTDEYGRTYIVCDMFYVVKGDGELGYPDTIQYDRDPSKWILE